MLPSKKKQRFCVLTIKYSIAFLLYLCLLLIFQQAVTYQRRFCYISIWYTSIVEGNDRLTCKCDHWAKDMRLSPVGGYRKKTQWQLSCYPHFWPIISCFIGSGAAQQSSCTVQAVAQKQIYPNPVGWLRQSYSEATLRNMINLISYISRG